MASATCKCYFINVNCDSITLTYENCDGIQISEELYYGDTRYVCSNTLPVLITTGCLNPSQPILLGDCTDGQCFSNTCYCWDVSCDNDNTILYVDSNDVFTAITYTAGTSITVCSKVKPQFYLPCTTNTNMLIGECIDDVCIPITTTTTFPITTTTTTSNPVPPTPLEPTNECDVITIYPMGIECISVNPSFSDTFDGSASLYITGGTPPYEILWENGSVGTTINNLGVGEYIATVTDTYGDFLIKSTCVLSAETPSPTTTTTSSTTLPQFGDLCVIYTRSNGKTYESSFSDFIYNGIFNDKPSWLSNDSQFFMYWNTGTTEEWLISGYTNFVVYNPNPVTPPLNGWNILGEGKTTITVLEGSCSLIPPVSMQLAINNPSCLDNGSIIITASGGIPPYQYSKDGGVTFQYNPIFNNLGGGNYSIFTKDSVGSQQTQLVTLTTSALPTTYNLILNRNGNNLSINITPSLPNGVSVIFDLIVNSQFYVAPLATSATNNSGANVLVNGTPITSNPPVINNTTTTNTCNGTTYITTKSLTWSNIIINNTTTFSGTLFNTTTAVLPQPPCYSTYATINTYINNAKIQGCECCNVVIIQEAKGKGEQLPAF